MKTEAIRKVLEEAEDCEFPEKWPTIQKAYAELSKLSEVQKALVRACAAVVYRQGDADSREALARDALRKAGIPL